jgi:hypothetical protein
VGDVLFDWEVVKRGKNVISHSSLVNLKVFNVLGKEIATLVNELKQPVEYPVQLNAGVCRAGFISIG